MTRTHGARTATPGWIGVAAALAAGLALAACGGTTSPASDPTSGAASRAAQNCPAADGSAPKKQQFTQAPVMCIDTAKTYTARVTTDVGDVVLSLDANKAPKTVNNFVVLSRHHFYDGVPFHRVIKGFVAQAGDPEGIGAGGPGYTIDDELPSAGEYREGSVAMANTGKPDTGGSQFFIVTGPAGTTLPPRYTLFGRVTKGMNVVRKIEADGAEASSSDAPPTKVHTIKAVTISEK